MLLTRRPDLPFIKLNCENTTTLLPHIDRVNEILEAYVASVDPKIARNTGDATADELRLNPQYVIDQAYVTPEPGRLSVCFALRPWKCRGLVLGVLNSSRHEVMKTFQLGADPADFTKGTPSRLALACEYLGISAEEHVILTGTDLAGKPITTRALPEFYGFPAATANADLITALQPAEKFLAVTGLSYSDVVNLVNTRFVNPSQAITLQVPVRRRSLRLELNETQWSGCDGVAAYPPLPSAADENRMEHGGSGQDHPSARVSGYRRWSPDEVGIHRSLAEEFEAPCFATGVLLVRC